MSKILFFLLFIPTLVLSAEMHQMNENDLALDISNADTVQNGREWYDRRCSFCHGAARSPPPAWGSGASHDERFLLICRAGCT